MRSYIKVCMCARTSLYVVLEVSPREQILLLCFQETFYRGLWYSPPLASAQKWYCAFVANPRSFDCLHPPGGNRKRFKDERHNNTTDNKESAEMLILSSPCHIRDQLQYPPFCQSWHVLLLYCVKYRTLKWHIWLSCSLFNLCFPFSTNTWEPLVLLLYVLGAKVL